MPHTDRPHDLDSFLDEAYRQAPLGGGHPLDDALARPEVEEPEVEEEEPPPQQPPAWTPRVHAPAATPGGRPALRAVATVMEWALALLIVFACLATFYGFFFRIPR